MQNATPVKEDARPEPEEFDSVIVGGGPAGLAAAIYTGRAELRTLILERLFVGGQVVLTYEVANYPGFPEVISGPDLIDRMRKQAEQFGPEIRTEEVEHVELVGDYKIIKTNANEYRTPTLIMAMGADPRKLDVPGETELRGHGVSYCGTCDAPFFRDKKVVCVGGGDAALKEALHIAKFASEVVLVHRRQEFRGEKIYQTEVQNHPKIGLVLDTVVERVNGKDHVEGVDTRNVQTDETGTIPCEGVFVFVGSVPNTNFLCNLFPVDCGGHVDTDHNMMTSVPGVFAVGDVRKHSYRQIATAVGEGVTAAMASEHWIAAIRAKEK